MLMDYKSYSIYTLFQSIQSAKVVILFHIRLSIWLYLNSKQNKHMIDALENWYLLENSAFDLILFLGIILLGMVLKRFFSNSFSKIVFRFIPEESISIQDCVQLLRKPFELLIFWIFLYLAAQNLKVPSQWNFTPIQDFLILLLLQHSMFLIPFLNSHVTGIQ